MKNILIYEQFLSRIFGKKERETEHKGVGFDINNNKLEKSPDLKSQTIDGFFILCQKYINIDKDSENELIGKGWKKVWVEKVESPKTTIKSEVPKTLELKFNKNNYFELGGYELSENFKLIISEELQKITTNHVIVGILIESSTDKTPLTPKLKNLLKDEGYTEDNQGLSKARANEIKKFLIKIGIDESLLKFTELSEMGKEGGYDPETRYVKLLISVETKPEAGKVDVNDEVSYFQRKQKKTVQKVPKLKRERGKTCKIYD